MKNCDPFASGVVTSSSTRDEAWKPPWTSVHVRRSDACGNTHTCACACCAMCMRNGILQTESAMYHGLRHDAWPDELSVPGFWQRMPGLRAVNCWLNIDVSRPAFLDIEEGWQFNTTRFGAQWQPPIAGSLGPQLRLSVPCIRSNDFAEGHNLCQLCPHG
jgi:hypothetical protein